MKMWGRVAFGLVVATCVAVCLPQAASAGWSANQAISGVGTGPENVEMDGAPDGRSFVVWRRVVAGDYVVQGAPVSADGVAGNVITLSAAGQDAEAPNVAIKSDGSATVVWTRSNGSNKIIQSVAVSAAGVKGTVFNRSAVGNNAIQPTVAYADNGSVAIGWKRFNGTHWIAQTKVVFADGTFDAVRDVSNSSVDARDVVRLVPLPGGTFRVAWIEGATESNSNVKTATISALGVPSAAVPVTTSADSPRYLDMDVNSSGNSVIVFQMFNDVASHWASALSRVPAGGSPSNYVLAAPSTKDAFEPEVGVAADGTATVTWTGYAASPSSTYFVEASQVSPQNTVGPLLSLSAGFTSGGYSGLDVNPAGWSTVVWAETQPMGVAPILSRRISPTGSIGEITQASDSQAKSSIYPMVEIADDGVATAAFPGFDALSKRYVWTSRFTDPGAAVDPTEASFGDRAINSGPGTSKTITITSSGSTPDNITAVALTGADVSQFHLTGADACLGNMPAGGSCQVSVAFDPTSTGAKSASVEVTSAAPVATATLTGTGVPPKTTVTMKSKSKAKSVKRGAKTKVKVQVRNTGAATAKKLKLCFTGDRKAVAPKKKCVSLGTLAPGKSKSKTVKVGLTTKAKAGKKYPVKFKLTSSNAPVRKATLKLKAK